MATKGFAKVVGVSDRDHIDGLFRKSINIVLSENLPADLLVRATQSALDVVVEHLQQAKEGISNRKIELED